MDYCHHSNNFMATWTRHILHAWWLHSHLTYNSYYYSTCKDNQGSKNVVIRNNNCQQV